MDYFKLATELARAEGEATLRRVATKTIALRSRDKVCGCSAYGFPHRPGGGKCPGGAERFGTEKLGKDDALELYLFDRDEAAAINRGW